MSKLTLSNSIKTICFLILAYFALALLIDYLSFKTLVKLELTEDKSGSRLPSITVCTESYYLDRAKVVSLLDQKHRDILVSSPIFHDAKFQQLLAIYKDHEILDDFYYTLTQRLTVNEFRSLMIGSERLFNCSKDGSSNQVLSDCRQIFDISETLYGKPFSRFLPS